MPRGDVVRAELFRFAKKRTEFDFAVAKHVRVGRSARGILGKEVGKHAIEIFFGEVYGEIGDVDGGAHLAHVGVIVGGGAYAVFVGFFPIAHEKTDHVIALLF